MDIKVREVKQIIVEEINLTANEWDKSLRGTVGWRSHMSTLMNQRVKRLAPQCSSPDEFFERMFQYTQDIGFGDYEVVVKLTETLYKVQKVEEEQAA